MRSVWQTETDSTLVGDKIFWKGRFWAQSETVKKWWKVIAVCSKLNGMFKWWSLRGGWIIWMRNPEWCRKLVPKMRWSLANRQRTNGHQVMTWYVALRQSQKWRIWGLLWSSLRQTAWWGRPSCRQRCNCTVMHSLYSIRCLTGSQWRSRSKQENS